MKQVVVLLRKAPFERVRASETLRMTLGLTLGQNRVTLVYLDRGVQNLLPVRPTQVGRPRVEESLSLFEACGIREVADADSLERWDISPAAPRIEILNREGIMDLIHSADVVLSM